MLSHHINAIATKHIKARAHVMACQKVGENKVSYIVANAYAPNKNNDEKIQFFENLLDAILEYEETFECKNLFRVGDLNVVLDATMLKNRQYNNQEKSCFTS